MVSIRELVHTCCNDLSSNSSESFYIRNLRLVLWCCGNHQLLTVPPCWKVCTVLVYTHCSGHFLGAHIGNSLVPFIPYTNFSFLTCVISCHCVNHRLIFCVSNPFSASLQNIIDVRVRLFEYSTVPAHLGNCHRQWLSSCCWSYKYSYIRYKLYQHCTHGNPSVQARYVGIVPSLILGNPILSLSVLTKDSGKERSSLQTSFQKSGTRTGTYCI